MSFSFPNSIRSAVPSPGGAIRKRFFSAHSPLRSEVGEIAQETGTGSAGLVVAIQDVAPPGERGFGAAPVRFRGRTDDPEPDGPAEFFRSRFLIS